MKSVRLFAVLAALSAAMVAVGHDTITTNLTYTRDIAPIFARRCVNCHGARDAVPLDSYVKARPWAVDIKEQVLSRNMPPWGAVKGFGDLAPDHGLTQEELLIIAAWVIGGAPEGSLAQVAKNQPPVAPTPAAQSGGKGVDVSTKLTLDGTFSLAAIRPGGQAVVKSARIVAVFPDGRVTPLLWLFHYDAKRMQETFRFRAPVVLPAGSVIQADSPLEFTLLSAKVR